MSCDVAESFVAEAKSGETGDAVIVPANGYHWQYRENFVDLSPLVLAQLFVKKRKNMTTDTRLHTCIT